MPLDSDLGTGLRVGMDTEQIILNAARAVRDAVRSVPGVSADIMHWSDVADRNGSRPLVMMGGLDHALVITDRYGMMTVRVSALGGRVVILDLRHASGDVGTAITAFLAQVRKDGYVPNVVGEHR